MKIDRSNYEIWFIDSLDGNLDSHQTDELTLFLNENPDLKEEFNELHLATVEPISKPFPLKEKLKKLPSDITQSQFEYLCVAYLENDLTIEQESELFDIITNESEKKKTFNLIQKTRVVPPSVNFKYKNRLIRRTAKEKIIWFSTIGLSAAAVVSFIITTYLASPDNIPSDITRLSVISNDVLNTNSHPSEIIPDKLAEEAQVVPEDKKSLKVKSSIRNQSADVANSESVSVMPGDSIKNNISSREHAIERIKISAPISYKEEIAPGKLVASATEIIIPEEDEERNRLSRFISKTFREKIMKEETTHRQTA